MKRREFLVLGFCAVAPPHTARAQQQDRIATVGVLVTGAANPSPEEFLKGFRAGLSQLGYIEGRNLRLEVRSGAGNATLLADKAAELIRLNPDLVVAHLTPAAQAAKQTTLAIPIVMAAVGDPLGTGLIKSLAHPGGNITGFSTAVAEVAGKSVEIIHELFPSVRRLGVLANELDPFSRPYLAQIEVSAQRLGLAVEPLVGRPSAPQQPMFEAMATKRVGALIVQGSMARQETVGLAAKHRLPSFGSGRAWPSIGGLMSYSANLNEMYHETAAYVDKVLKGRRPADLPVALPTKFDLVVNMKTAKAIGITIPEAFLARADEVIE
jgi:putative ABC transport system substrate-binding protein